MSVNDQFDDFQAKLTALEDVLSTADLPPADPVEVLVGSYVTFRTWGMNEGRTPPSRDVVLLNMADALAAYPEARAKIDALGW